MFKRFRQRQQYLHLRLTKAIALIAAFFALASSWLFYQWTFENETQLAKRLITQLVKTVEDRAAVGAYLDNPDIPQQVAESLGKHDVIAGVVISTHTNLRTTHLKHDVEQGNQLQWLYFPLKNPFADDDADEQAVLGEIVIHPNQPLIESRARAAAWQQAMFMNLQILLVAILVMALVHHVVTRPLRCIAADLHNINPQVEGQLRCPPGHERDEIGGLVDDINDLLVTVYYVLQTEREQRAMIESLSKQFRLIFERASTGILLMKSSGELVLANSALANLVGGDLSGKHVLAWFQHPDDMRAIIQETLSMPQPVSRDLALATDLDSSVEWVHCLFSKVEGDNNELFIEVVINDITERKQKEQRIRFEADHDPLTHALNRRAGENILQQHLDTAENKNESYAILLIDLDKFKPVNDNYGHEAGDSVLIQVTKRLQQNLRQNDLVIRWGGDEFVVALRNFRDSTDVATVAEKLVGALNIPIELEDGRLCQIGASIGIALYPLHGEQLNDLTACADIAMYDIKEHGRNGFCIFDNEPRKRVTWYLHKAAKTDNAASSTDACIMVIDDSADIRVFLRVLISGYGYRVLIAEDGRQALQMLREKKPDLILLDVMMPGLNGFDVCRQIKDMPQLSAVPILFLSAASGEEEKVRAFEMGGVDYITKPVQQAEVMARIRTHLALSLLQNELRDSHQALQQQHEELAAFTYTLTHDLSLPFQQLIALTQQYDVENCDAFGDLSHNLSKTAKTIAALSLLGEVFGQTEITAETLDMAAILHRALKRLDIPATIVVEQPATWPTTFGVANWIEEVWVQYINNALQYGGDNIKLDWEYGDGFVRFWTRDNGAGLSDAEQAKLFIPFTRLHKDATAGHGLGLSIIRAIVLKLDGIVGVESTPQQGCQFYFTLPSASGEKLKT